MAFDVKSEILAAINKTNDENMRTVLLLLYGVFEELGQKIDGMMADEKRLREAVLNGYSGTHDDDHAWIEEQRKLNCHEICHWVKGFKEEHESAKAAKEGMKNAALKGFATKLAEYAAVGVVAAITYRWFG